MGCARNDETSPEARELLGLLVSLFCQHPSEVPGRGFEPVAVTERTAIIHGATSRRCSDPCLPNRHPPAGLAVQGRKC